MSAVPVPPPLMTSKSPPETCGEKVNIKSEQITNPLYESNAQKELLETRNRLWELEGWVDPPLLTVYQYLSPILQEGPQCGLVALAMAASSTQHRVSVEDLFHEAKNKGFSYQGEMFSVDDMASLALSTLPEVGVRIIEGLLENRDVVIQSIAHGAILLVPYDADRNHEPCCRQGHKAHWAAVCGALVCSQKCFVAARQGKSRRLMLWDYEHLAASNENLIEFSPERGEDSSKYLLPKGGVQAGLCGRAVLLQRI